MITQRIIQCILSAVAAASVLFFLGYEFIESSTRDIGAAIFLAFLGAAALSPIVVWWVLSHFLKSSASRYVLLVGAALSFGFGGVAYYEGLVVHQEALSVLILLFLPMWQIGALAVLFGISFYVERRRQRHDVAS